MAALRDLPIEPRGQQANTYISMSLLYAFINRYDRASNGYD